jgi:hypothetical protein
MNVSKRTRVLLAVFCIATFLAMWLDWQVPNSNMARWLYGFAVGVILPEAIEVLCS